MSIHYEYDPECLLITPLVAVNTVECSNPSCGEDHGCCLVFGWFFWNIIFHFRDQCPHRDLNE